MDPNQPQSQPQWSPPPQQPMGWGGPGYGGPPPRPTGVTLAGIFLIVIGAFALLAGVLLIAGGAALSSIFGDLQGGGVFAAVGAFFGIVLIFWAVLHLLGGIGSLRGRGWGRWIGIVVAVISLIFGVLGLLSAIGHIGNNPGGLIYSVVFVLLYGLTAWALISAGAYFSARR
jgi:hypothetical protein